MHLAVSVGLKQLQDRVKELEVALYGPTGEKMDALSKLHKKIHEEAERNA